MGRVTTYIRFMWLPAWQPQNRVAGKLLRFYGRKTEFVPRLQIVVRSIPDRAAESNWILSDSVKGEQIATDASTVLNLLREKHFCMSIEHNTKAALYLDVGLLAMLLDHLPLLGHAKRYGYGRHSIWHPRAHQGRPGCAYAVSVLVQHEFWGFRVDYHQPSHNGTTTRSEQAHTSLRSASAKCSSA